MKTKLSYSNAMPNNIIVLSNGALGVREELEEKFDSLEIAVATTTHGTVRIRNNTEETITVEHRGRGGLWVEENSSGNDWHKSFGPPFGALQTIPPASMSSLLVDKLAANSTINSLTALGGFRNGEVLESPQNRQIFSDVIREISEVFDADEARLTKFVTKVIDDTQNNKSSMLADVERGLRTEVDYFNGYVVRRGKQLGIDVTANENLTARVKELEKNGNSNVEPFE